MSKTIDEHSEKEDARVVRTRWMNKDANTILLTILHQKKVPVKPTHKVLMIPIDEGILIKILEMEDVG